MNEFYNVKLILSITVNIVYTVKFNVVKFINFIMKRITSLRSSQRSLICSKGEYFAAN